MKTRSSAENDLRRRGERRVTVEGKSKLFRWPNRAGIEASASNISEVDRGLAEEALVDIVSADFCSIIVVRTVPWP
jgi:hypothetical protein